MFELSKILLDRYDRLEEQVAISWFADKTRGFMSRYQKRKMGVGREVSASDLMNAIFFSEPFCIIVVA